MIQRVAYRLVGNVMVTWVSSLNFSLFLSKIIKNNKNLLLFYFLTDCKDETDERNCSNCFVGQLYCGSGVCIDREAICDGRHNCPDGRDERQCCKLMIFSMLSSAF